MRIAYSTIVLFTLFFVYGCKDPYYPEIEPTQTNFLVVEGFIGNGDSATQIRLSRSVPVYDSVVIKPEAGAVVTVEGDDNRIYRLQENARGLYTLANVNFDPARKYRLKMRTTNGSEYESDFLAVKQTAPVDINWKQGSAGVNITFSSQDPTNNSLYYKWSYEETWEIISPYDATYKFVNSVMVQRNATEKQLMKRCWGRTFPTNIRLVSTIPLAKDVIDNEPVIFIPSTNEKLNTRYSILVKLQAIDKQAYEFYQLMKKNTESLGSIFDPQPSDISGNIRCLTRPNEKVIGFVFASNLQQKRIFITRSELMGWNFRHGCVEDDFGPDKYYVFEGDGAIAFRLNGPGAYRAVAQYCADCRNRGNNERPNFW